MVNECMMLGYVVAFISVARLPVVAKLDMLDVAAQPMEPHVHGLDPAGGNVLLVFIGVGGRGWSIAMRACWSGIASL